MGTHTLSGADPHGVGGVCDTDAPRAGSPARDRVPAVSSPAPSAGRLALVLVAAVLAISLAAIFTRLADAPGGVVALWRMVIATLLIVPAGLRGLRKADRKSTRLNSS